MTDNYGGYIQYFLEIIIDGLSKKTSRRISGVYRGGKIEWCPGTESNCRHEDFQSSALPTELPGLTSKGARIKLGYGMIVK